MDLYIEIHLVSDTLQILPQRGILESKEKG